MKDISNDIYEYFMKPGESHHTFYIGKRVENIKQTALNFESDIHVGLSVPGDEKRNGISMAFACYCGPPTQKPTVRELNLKVNVNTKFI